MFDDVDDKNQKFKHVSIVLNYIWTIILYLKKRKKMLCGHA